MPDHSFPKGTCLIVGDSILAGVGENRLKSGKQKIKLRYLPGARTDDMFRDHTFMTSFGILAAYRLYLVDVSIIYHACAAHNSATKNQFKLNSIFCSKTQANTSHLEC